VVPGGYGGYYPWGYAGLGFGGYYPWGYAGLRFAAYYPWGYAGLGFWPAYDPWYGYPVRYYSPRDEGRLRLKIKPREASVYVDGYYAGHVDDFDGTFQSLPLEPGPYRIEIRADGYAPYFFDVRVLPDRTLTYTATLETLP
jgi:PEGA domain